MAKKRKRKLFSKTALVYMLTFIVVTFCTAFLTVTVNYDNYILNNSSNILGNTGESGSNALSSTISNLMAISGGNVNVSMSAESAEGDSLDIDANIKIKMQGGLDNFECNVDLVLYFNDSPFVLRVAVANGILYLSVNDSHLKFEADNLVDSITGILGVVGMGLDGASSIAGMFDMNALMGMASSLKEVETATGTSLKIEEANMNVSMNVTEDYMLESIDIGTISVGSYTATGAVTMSDINSNAITIEPPHDESEYEDISLPVKVFSALSGLTGSDFKANAALKVLGANIDLGVVFDKDTNIGKVSAGAGAIDFDVFIANGDFYFKSNNAKIRAGDLSAVSFIDGLGVLASEIGGYASEDSSAPAFDFEALTKIDLESILSKFSQSGDKIICSLLDQDIIFTMSDDKIINISTKGDISLDLDFIYGDQEIIFSDFGYVPLEKMSWVLKPIVNFISTSKMSTTINYEYADLSGQLMLRVDLRDARAIQLNTELFGKDIELIVTADNILMRIDGESTKIQTKDFGLLALAIFDKLGGEIELETAINIQEMLDSAMKLMFADENAVILKGQNSVLQYASNGHVLYEGIVGGEKLKLAIQIDNKPRNIREYFVHLYSDFVFTSTLAQNTINYINGKVYNFSVSGVYNNEKVTANIFADAVAQRFAIDLIYNGEKVNLVLQDGVYYIAYRQFKFYGDSESAFKMLASAVSASSADKMLATNIENLTGELIEKSSKLDFIDIITGIKIGNISMKNGEFAISMERLAGLEDILDIENLLLTIKTKQDNLSAVKVDYSSTSLEVLLIDDIVAPLTETEIAEYTLCIDDILELANNTYNYILGGSYLFNVYVNYANYSVSGALGFADNMLVADLTFAVDGENVYLKIVDGNAYLKYAGFAISANQSDIGAIFALLNKFGVNISKSDADAVKDKLIAMSSEKITDATFAEILKQFNIDSVILYNNDGTYSIGYDNYVVNILTQDNYLAGVSATIDGVTVDIDLVSSIDVEVSDKYIALGDLISIVSNTYDYVNAGSYNFAINLSYTDYSVSGVVGYNKGNFVANLIIDIAGQQIFVKVLAGKLYVNYANLAFVGEAADIAKLTAILAEFGFNIDVSGLVNKLKQVAGEIDIKAQINKILAGFDIYKVTFTENAGVYTLGYDNYFVYVSSQNNKLTGINATIEGVSVGLNLVDEAQVSVSGSYVKVGDLINIIKNTYDYINSNSYIFNVSASYTDYDISGKLSVVSGKLLADLVITIAEEIIYLKIVNNTAYINFANLAFSGSLSDIGTLKGCLGKLGVTVDTNALTEAVTNTIKSSLQSAEKQITKEKILSIIKSINPSEIVFTETNGVYTVGYGNYTINIDTIDNEITGVSALIEGVNVDIDIISAFSVNPVGDYVKVGDLLALASNEYDYITGNVAFAFEIDVDGMIFTGKSFITNGLVSAIVNTTIAGKPASIKFIGDTLYIDFNGLKVKGDAEDYEKLAYVVEKNTGIKLPSLAKMNIKEILKCYEDIVSFVTSNFKVSMPDAPNIDGNSKVSLTQIVNAIKELSIINTANGLKVTYKDIAVELMTSDNRLDKAEIVLSDDRIGIQKIATEKLDTDENEYISCGELLDVVDKTINTLSTKALTGVINLDFMFEGRSHSVEINYNINFENLKDIRGKINFEFKGVVAEIIYSKGMLYMDIAGLRISLPLAEYKEIIKFVETRFGVNANVGGLVDSVFREVANYNFIKSWFVCEDMAEFLLQGDLGILLDFIEDSISKVTFTQGTVKAIVTLVPKTNVVIPEKYTGYRDYKDVLTLIDNVLALGDRDGFDITADAFVYDGSAKRFNVGIDLEVSIKNVIKAYGNALVYNGAGELLYDVDAALDNEVIYINFKGLKLQIKQQNLMEILVVALSALGIDANAIPWLNAVDDEFKFVSGNLKNIMPVLQMDTLGMLAIIKSMSYEGNIFTITLKGDMVTAAATQDMTISIDFTGGTINSIDLYNIYTGVTEGEYFNLEIDLHKYTGVTTLADKNNLDENGELLYKDISGVSDLLAAFVNTSELKDYSIEGDITFNAVSIINMTVHVSAGVKILDNNKIYSQITITNIPVVGKVFGFMVNGKDGYDIENRVFNIYIYEDVVYLHRTERQRTKGFLGMGAGQWENVEKKLAITLEQFMANALDYIMCFGLGFEEGGAIMNAIYESLAIQRPADDPLDLGKVLLQYKETKDKAHYFLLNLYELTYNENLKTIDATISTINNASTGYKDYLHNLALNMIMPIKVISSMSVTLTLKSENIQLVNIGQAADVSKAINYVNGYNYKLGESYVITNGNAVLESNLQYTAYYFSDGELVRSETLNLGEALNLTPPVKHNAFIDGVEYAYTFTGWYTDEACTKRFTGTTMPVNGIHLIAGYSATAYRNVYFDEQGGENISDIYALAGTGINLSTITVPNKFITSGAYTYEYALDFWSLNGERVDSFTIPDSDTTFIANWKLVNTTIANTLLTIISGPNTYTARITVGDSIDLYSMGADINESTMFYKDAAFTTINDITHMPDYDLTLYACNLYTITFVTGTNDKVDSSSKYEGKNVNLVSNLTRASYDDGSVRIDYTFAGWYFASDPNTLYNGNIAMPYGGGRLIAKWNERVRQYFTVSFNVQTIDSWSKYYYSNTPASLKILQGEKLQDYLPTTGLYVPTAYKETWFGLSKEYATFNGWKVNGAWVDSKTIVDGNMTLEASWST